MSTTILKQRTRSGNHVSPADVERQIRRGKAVLRELKATLEDRRELAAAKKRNRGKAGTPLGEAVKELGL